MTREEAIEILSRPKSMKGVPAEVLTAHTMAIKALEQEPKWIPVSERLPEKTGRYLITYCYQDEIETQEAVYVEGEEDKWYDTTDIEITLAVIAWMPLPEPYKAEKE